MIATGMYIHALVLNDRLKDIEFKVISLLIALDMTWALVWGVPLYAS